MASFYNSAPTYSTTGTGDGPIVVIVLDETAYSSNVTELPMLPPAPSDEYMGRRERAALDLAAACLMDPPRLDRHRAPPTRHSFTRARAGGRGGLGVRNFQRR